MAEVDRRIPPAQPRPFGDDDRRGVGEAGRYEEPEGVEQLIHNGDRLCVTDSTWGRAPLASRPVVLLIQPPSGRLVHFEPLAVWVVWYTFGPSRRGHGRHYWRLAVGHELQPTP